MGHNNRIGSAGLEALAISKHTEALRVLEVFKVVKPIRDLTEGVLEAGAPLGVLSLSSGF